jgi:putative membrane protein
VNLARLELRRFTRSPLTRAALALLTLVPLLYGALYLWAFWDPYGNVNKIPVALVVEDRPATASDGTRVDAGRDLADKLVERDVFAWHRTDQAEAARGLEDGAYHLELRIPAEFSADLVTPPDPDRSPERGTLSVVSDDATNYLSGLLARSAFTEIRTAAATSAARGYVDKMLVGFTDIKAQTREAADGAGKLADGTGRARTGADQVDDGTGRAAAGAGTLADGLDTASAGARDLATGLAALDAGAAQLADGTARAAAGSRLLADRVDAVAGPAVPALRRDAASIAAAATTIADGADLVAANLDALPALAGQAVTGTTTARDQLDALAAAHPELAGDPRLAAAREAAGQAVTTATQIRDRVGAGDLAALRTRLRQVAATARQVAAAAPHLADDVARARAQVDQLADGMAAVATGADRLAAGTHRAAGGANQLAGGLYRLDSGARQLDAGLTSLSAGTARLASGLATLDGGAHDLAHGLADGADRIPGYDAADRAQRAGILADPVGLHRDVRHAAKTYGVGFAPYFLALALWVGAMISYMLLRPLTRRHVMAGGPAWRVALAGYLPGVAVGVAQAGALFLVLRFGLGLHPVHPVAMAAFLALAAASFAAILQFLGARLGPAGRIVALALLMLQLTSSGGTYPVQTSPGFFQALHPWLPMTYVVDSLRHLVSGGPAGTVVRGSLVLAAFAAGALLLTTAAARRARRLTPTGLHPELAM